MIFQLFNIFNSTIKESIDREIPVQGHNKLLYTVWNEKTNFVKIAADRNYFKSSYFAWMDIGFLRSEVLVCVMSTEIYDLTYSRK